MLEKLDIHISYAVKMDEFWSFVDSKTQRRWTWYAIERKSGVVVAWHNGSRGNESLEALLEKIRMFPCLMVEVGDDGYLNVLDSGYCFNLTIVEYGY